MKQFLSDNKKIIGKLIRTHAVMAIFGIMVFIPFNRDSITLKYIMLAGSIISTLLFLFLIDVDMWYLGAEDRIRVDSGKIKCSPVKGLLLGLIAEIPSLVFGILYAVISVVWTYYQSYPAGDALSVVRVILWGICNLWNGMYNGILQFSFGTTTIALCHLVTPFIPILFTWLTYTLGFKGSNFLKPPAREKKIPNE